jgi:hypothetical protein
MGRPIYETSRDMDAEREIAETIAQKYNATAIKAKRLYGLDWFFERDGYVVGMVEIKVRNYYRNDFTTYMISADKVARIRLLAGVTGVPAFLFVSWKDGIGYINLCDEPDYNAIGGRRDRGDDQDVEVMLHYLIDRFVAV